MTNLEFAKLYLSLGWSIIPIRPESKVPAIPEWKQYQTRKATLSEVETWFKDESTNIALITGEISNLVVVDSDLYKENANNFSQTSLLQVYTPRGGRHDYYKYTPIGNSVNATVATDIRGNGGYVLVPGSIGANLKQYVWNELPTKELLDKLPELPKEILETASRRREASNFDLASSIGVSEGGRNDALYKACVSMLSKLKDGDKETVGWSTILGINNTFKPPLTEYEVKTIFNSALSFVQNNPPLGSLSLRNDKLSVRTDNWKPTTLIEDIEKVKQEYKLGLPKGIPSGYPSLDKITGGLIPGQTYLVFADTNTGKSAFVLNVMVKLAKQNIRSVYFDLENQYSLTAERQVLINEDFLTKEAWTLAVDENRIDEFLDKLTKLPLRVWDLTKLQNRFGEITYQGVETCILEGVKSGGKVFAIDHLHYFEPGEKDYSKLQEIARKLNDLAATQNIVIILVAHTKKGLAYEKDGAVTVKRPVIDDVNGSSLIAKHTKNTIAIMRNAMAESPFEREKTTIFIDKTKYGPSGKFELRFTPENLHFTEVGSSPQRDNLKLQLPEKEVCNMCGSEKTWLEDQKRYLCLTCHP